MMNVAQVAPLQSFGPGGYPLEAIRASSLVTAVAAVLVATVERLREYDTEREN